MHILALESADVGFHHVLDMRLEYLVLLTKEECYLSNMKSYYVWIKNQNSGKYRVLGIKHPSDVVLCYWSLDAFGVRTQ
ncbi:hypothetical protein MA16_Dca017061 [Dendrobium catenatum]|uniref:Uncharacterized protein n=1 Tax=Dendrobium catenatum TaxID=906689 RepID=A0A2I0W5Z2_9ASPA|nr:hypothetical protein MA16_Dca017061 [Dendrobium catenatum]